MFSFMLVSLFICYAESAKLSYIQHHWCESRSWCESHSDRHDHRVALFYARYAPRQKKQLSIYCTLGEVDCVWNVMTQAQKPDFVFRRNGRVHLNRRGRQFSRLMAVEVCASSVVMLKTPFSEVVWRVLATHSIRRFPLHFPSRASPRAITLQLDYTNWGWRNNWALTVFYVRYVLRILIQDCLKLNMEELRSSETPVAVYPSIRPKVSHELASSICRNSLLLRLIKTRP